MLSIWAIIGTVLACTEYARAGTQAGARINLYSMR